MGEREREREREREGEREHTFEVKVSKVVVPHRVPVSILPKEPSRETLQEHLYIQEKEEREALEQFN